LTFHIKNGYNASPLLEPPRIEVFDEWCYAEQEVLLLSYDMGKAENLLFTQDSRGASIVADLNLEKFGLSRIGSAPCW
jgi:hypothetical protein